MAIVRWNPWNLSQFSQMLDDNNPVDIRWEETALADVSEDSENVYVDIMLPGFNEENVKVTIEGSTLTIRGEMTDEKENKGKKYYRKEIRSQSVVRSITLPTGVASDKADAQFSNGILKLTLPKAEEAKPKEILLKTSKIK